jgi:predicted ATP-grasp superfamily ATP-dependent carboligase
MNNNQSENQINKVILIGENHHNGLGLVRSFGINGIKPYGIILSEDNKKGFASRSKYWSKVYTATNEDQVLEILTNEFTNEVLPPVIIPWSDSTTMIIDNNLNLLKEKFIVPSLDEKQGAIVRMMDKDKQIEFANKNNLPMAKSWILELNDYSFPEDVSFPVIFKPVASKDGTKADIRKCDNIISARNYLKELQTKRYKRILLQEYLSFDSEIVFDGSCSESPAYYVSKNIREWPPVGGSSAFFQCIDDEKVHSICSQILDSLKAEKFTGLFDIELFDVGGTIYLNEINWRNSGNGFFQQGSGLHYDLIWYYTMIGKETSELMHTCKNSEMYGMVEAVDLRHVVFNGLKLGQWFTDRKKTTSFALWYGPDMKPAIYQYIHLFIELLKQLLSRK